MNRQSTLVNMILEGGGLILFWGLGMAGMEHYATAAVVLFVIGDGLRRHFAGLDFPRTWLLFNGLALLLAILDFAVAGRGIAQYEAILASLVIALIFALGALGRRPLVQEIAEQRQGEPFPEDRHDLQAFFRAYTWIWAAYFVIKAGIYLWLTETVPLDRAHSLEGVIGPVSLFIMIFISFRGKALFQLAQRAGLFREQQRL